MLGKIQRYDKKDANLTRANKKIPPRWIGGIFRDKVHGLTLLIVNAVDREVNERQKLGDSAWLSVCEEDKPSNEIKIKNATK